MASSLGPDFSPIILLEGSTMSGKSRQKQGKLATTKGNLVKSKLAQALLAKTQKNMRNNSVLSFSTGSLGVGRVGDWIQTTQDFLNNEYCPLPLILARLILGPL